ncbi:MAG: His/Gly/Thr/Pro-type tRNA ligase C-terminal domain-containing protein, partial [Chloroflexota bacterium]
PLDAVRSVAPATMIYAVGGTRRAAALAGVSMGDAYAHWLGPRIVETSTVCFRLGVQHLILPVGRPQIFAETGLVDFELQVNTLPDVPCRPKVRDALTAYFAEHRDALSEESRRRLDTSVLRILDSKDPRDRSVIAGAPDLHQLLCPEDRAHFDAVVAGLDRLGIRHRVLPTLVRGLDYYTRTVCEFVLTDPGSTKGGDIAVAAGGRYDGLVRTMGGPDVAGVGIAGGTDVLYYALKQQGAVLGEEPAADVYILSAQPDDAADRTQLANPLRDAGFTVAIDYSARPLDRQLESAVKHGAKVAVIRGTEEARGGHVIVRDLLAKEQRVTRLAAVVTEVGRHVPRRPKPTLASPGPAQPTGEA